MSRWITVSENPSTGNTWIVDEQAADVQGFNWSSEFYYPNDDLAWGRPGIRKFTFGLDWSYDMNGEAPLFRAVYAKPWEFQGWENFDASNHLSAHFINLPIKPKE